MKKLFILAALFTILPAGYAFGGGRTRTDFSGNWVLNMQKTQDVPSRLQSYKMNVKQTGTQLIVHSKVEGEFRRAERSGGDEGGSGSPEGGGYPGGGPEGGNYPGGGGGYPGGGYPGGGRFPGGGGFPGGGFPGGRRGGRFPGGAGGRGEQMRKGMAFMMVTPRATYNLDGTKTTTDIDKPIPGSATLQAAWKKSGKQLELSRVEDLRGGERTIKVHEHWTMTKDGLLQIERNVDTPRGSTKVKMYFTKIEKTSGGA